MRRMGEAVTGTGAGSAKAFGSFSEFYPFYLSQHADRTCRRLHFVGTTLGLAALLHAFATLNFWWLLAGTFTHPLYSFIGDWAMWRDILAGKIRL
jgi:hypothetical protein